MTFTSLGYITMVLGGIACTCALIYGIYILLFDTVSIGLMFIGGAFVGGLILNFTSRLLFFIGGAFLVIGVKNEA